MSEGFTALQRDSRTFGRLQQRLLDDLNRPDLSNVAREYIQDAIRNFQRLPFFFNNTDNSQTVSWAANTTYPQGSTVVFSNGGSTYVAVAANTGTSAAGFGPAFTTTLFTPPSGSNQFPPPPAGPGTTDDNGGPPTGIRWLTAANLTASGQSLNYWTQLSTVYGINQYLPPIDYVAPRLVEVTAASMRYPLRPCDYEELRSYDVIRPSPITVYPTDWAYFQEQIYVWPYPNGFYPLTLSYRTAPAIPRSADSSNFWTTKAELLIRSYAQYLICLQILKDPDSANAALEVCNRELTAIRSEGISQEILEPIPSSGW